MRTPKIVLSTVFCLVGFAVDIVCQRYMTLKRLNVQAIFTTCFISGLLDVNNVSFSITRHENT